MFLFFKKKLCQLNYGVFHSVKRERERTQRRRAPTAFWLVLGFCEPLLFLCFLSTANGWGAGSRQLGAAGAAAGWNDPPAGARPRHVAQGERMMDPTSNQRNSALARDVAVTSRIESSKQSNRLTFSFTHNYLPGPQHNAALEEIDELYRQVYLTSFCTTIVRHLFRLCISVSSTSNFRGTCDTLPCLSTKHSMKLFTPALHAALHSP